MHQLAGRRSRLAIRSAMLLLLIAVLALSLSSAVLAQTGPQPPAKNLIIMIADGSGYNSFLATEYYQNGAAGANAYDAFTGNLAYFTNVHGL